MNLDNHSIYDILKLMKIEIINQKITDFAGDVIIVNLFEGVTSPGGATGAVDRALNGIISRLIKKGEIKGEFAETTIIHTPEKLKTERVLVVGLGKQKEFDLEQLRKIAGAAAHACRKIRAKRIGTIVHGAGIGGIAPEKACQALVEGTILGLYQFKEYKKIENSQIKEFAIVELDKKKIKPFKKGLKIGEILAQSQNIARDLINEPANNLTPEKLETRIKTLIKTTGLSKVIGFKCLYRKDLEKFGMGALLSVSQGSCNEPRLIILRLKNSNKPLTTLIGKTVTFDSGGISLKPSAGMGAMKGDMAGGAAVIGATIALARAKARINLMTLIPAVENMPSGSASRPGDVVRAMNGKTIEIISTDAEGRMTLADAICYAEKQKAETIIDIATLTGGCVIALGDLTAAVMGNDQRLIDKLLSTSKRSGEHLWQLPLFKEYSEQLKSEIADLKNSGGRKASAITAGVFLQSFVDNARWLHIDMAGKESSEKSGFYTPAGGTGFGVRTLFEFVNEEL